jgi:hypothetical protein
MSQGAGLYALTGRSVFYRGSHTQTGENAASRGGGQSMLDTRAAWL